VNFQVVFMALNLIVSPKTELYAFLFAIFILFNGETAGAVAVSILVWIPYSLFSSSE